MTVTDRLMIISRLPEMQSLRSRSASDQRWLSIRFRLGFLWHLHSFTRSFTLSLDLMTQCLCFSRSRRHKKYEAFTLTQTCELNIEITVSKNCNPLFSLMIPFQLLYGSCGPQCKKNLVRMLQKEPTLGVHLREGSNLKTVKQND